MGNLGGYILPRNPKEQSRTLALFAHQEEFAWSDSHTTFLAGGWASAKTVSLAAYCQASVAMNPGGTGLVILPTHRMVGEFANNVLAPMMRGQISGMSHANKTFFLRDGGRIVFLSGERTNLIEMYNCSWGAADEVGAMKKDLLMRMSARLREPIAKRPRLGFSGVPIFGYLRDEFDGRNDSERKIIHASMESNPYLTKEYIQTLYNSVPARLVKAFIKGQFVPPGGTVYSEFDPEVHLVNWQYRRDLPCVASIDWSPRTPHVVFFQMLPEDAIINGHRLRKLNKSHDWAGTIAFDEVVLDGAVNTITRERLLTEVRNRGYSLSYFTGDPAGNSAQSASTWSDIKVAKQMLGVEAKLPRTATQKSIKNGVGHVQNMLMPMDSTPRFFVSREMANKADELLPHLRGRALFNALIAYSYPEGDMSGTPEKDGICDHACDCTRYHIVVAFESSRSLSTVRQAA